MRVIAGSARGTRLARVPRGTRPVSDRAREGVFSSLGDRVVDAACADLFAGTGALGIEALSRGAARCTFVESAPAAVRVIRENLARTGTDGRVVRADVRRFLEREAGGYDLAFLDPPYETDVADVLGALEPHLLTGGTVVVTRRRQDPTGAIPVDLQVVRRLDYGEARILVLEVQ